jgi:uncharacterized membrane protein YdjX (TVP38/TMEM64 family)
MKKWIKYGVFALVAIGFIVWLYGFGGKDLFTLDNMVTFLNDIEGYGILVPIVYVIFYWLVCLFFIPATPITLLGGLIFGPVKGTMLISFASTTGATLSFLVAKTVGRDAILNKFGDSTTFKKIDQGVKENGWRMLMITRLVPIFPFNLQNYLYGLTDISTGTYMLVSWLCMLPGTIAYAVLAGSIVSGDGNIGKMAIYLAIGAVLIVGLSFIPKILEKKGVVSDIISEESE